MRREFLAVANGVAIASLASACARSTPDRADTSTATAEAHVIASRDTAAVASAEAALSTAPKLPTATAETESSVIQPIVCTPARFGPGDTLTLRMGTPHGDMLSIHAPDNRTVYSLEEPTLGKPRRNYSLIPPEEFRKVATFPVPADVRAIALVVGRDTTPEPVFTKPGKYMVVMGENLASDYSNRSTKCTVTFLSPSK
jgi:hypothetical protein